MEAYRRLGVFVVYKKFYLEVATPSFDIGPCAVTITEIFNPKELSHHCPEYFLCIVQNA
jgi:hypothetical protein